jgi:hypothetical protein
MEGDAFEMKGQVYIRKLSENDFLNMKSAWSGLLASSDADGLFMSWAWQYSWWEVWGQRLKLELLLLGAYDREGTLIGLAPLYRHLIRTSFGFSFKRLQVIGNAWKLAPTVRTEYISLITKKEEKQLVIESFILYLRNLEWDAFVMPDCKQSDGSDFDERIGKASNMTRIIRNISYGVVVRTDGLFSDWLRAVGRNTRLKAFNRRKFFCGDLGGEFSRLDETSQKSYAEFFELLNKFHIARWGRGCFDDLAVRFHCLFLQRLSGDQAPHLSELVVGNRVVSVLYDVQSGSRIYNLQSGYEENFDSKLSLGTLHFGFSIESSFEREGVDFYDFLAGAGKNEFYKSHFSGEGVSFPTVDLVRSRFIKVAYFCRPWLFSSIVSRVARAFRL